LEMANAALRPARRLRWHYRSRHSALIAFSNHFVYDNDLVVFPSASESRPGMGVSLVQVSGFCTAGVNVEEANVMVEAILKFMKDYPNRSLGVAVMNQKQKELLREKFELIAKQDKDASKYVERWKKKNEGLEQFFIKNLENVQGDERDVIFIGTVYGRTHEGVPVMQRFGPINGITGKRRLNVLFSRAKEQIVTFSSMVSTDIKAEENGNQGVYMLKRWLEYSGGGLLYDTTMAKRGTDSDFEDFVIKQIESIGCEAVPQVGVSGYFIDIGIRHPSWPFGFIMGVECDGANYHSSKSARDRDRLRQEVLEGLGWHLHRIWSTDWFNDHRRESERLRKAIQDRLKILCQLRTQPSEPISAAESNERKAFDVEFSNDEKVSDNGADDEKDDIDEPEEDDESDEEEDGDDVGGEAGLDENSPIKLVDLTSAEISSTIPKLLQQCPNNSCTVKSVSTRVLKDYGIITRGKPRSHFRRRVNTCLKNLEYLEQIERYRSKNERIRLINYTYAQRASSPPFVSNDSASDADFYSKMRLYEDATREARRLSELKGWSFGDILKDADGDFVAKVDDVWRCFQKGEWLECAEDPDL